MDKEKRAENLTAYQGTLRMMNIPQPLEIVLRTIDDAGGIAYLVGGCVRDHLRGFTPQDYDTEVFGLSPEKLQSILGAFGTVSLVGESFGVYKVRFANGEVSDFSLPREDSKVGPKHTDFNIQVDPGLSTKQAAARRDFTINSLMYDARTQSVLDHFGGIKDLEQGVLRPTSEHFAEDPLRILRGMQFAARFDTQASPELYSIGRQLYIEYYSLARERVWAEWYKWTTGVRPSSGLRFLEAVGWLSLYPQLYDMKGLPQSAEWHPEGDCDVHVLHVCDAAARIADQEGLIGEDRAVLLFAALLHDVGKPQTTVFDKGRWRSPGHAEAGVPIAKQFLESIGCLQRITERVLPLVQEHMFPTEDKVTPRALRRLMVRLEPEGLKNLHRLMEADNSGRPPLPAGPLAGSNQLLEMSVSLPTKIEPVLKGRHLLATGKWTPGPEMGAVLRTAFEAQLDGEFETLEEAMVWLEKNHSAGTQSPQN